ncbi:MAG TPA: hypothetical protein VKV15_03025 [Bryobacteraceae bacterium]|nr:hypothetical protein [Bryobacteraceae bacterium]
MAHVGITREVQAGAGSVPNPFTRMYTPRELAELWQLSEQSIRRLFQDRPGVLKIGESNPRGRRGYTTLRIPAVVVEQIFEERSK